VANLQQRREAHRNAERGCRETEGGGDVHETSETDDGTTTAVRSVAEIAALAILAVERWAEVGRVHVTSVAERLI